MEPRLGLEDMCRSAGKQRPCNEENMVPTLESSQLRAETDAWAAPIPRAPSWAEWGHALVGTGSCKPSMPRTNPERCLDSKNCSAFWL